MLAVLVQRRGRSVPPEVLLDLVWGDAALGLNPTAVHTVVARLRRQLSAPDLVRTGREGYLLPLEVDVDAVDHEHLIRSARDLRSAGQVDEAVRRYRRALALWSGPLAYEGVTDELVLAERTRLEDAKATANEQLATLLLEGGTVPHLEEALAVANDLVGEFPLREGPTRLVMRAAYALGSQAEALRAYADLRTRLREELGIDPSPPTQALHAQVLAQAESLVAPARPEHRRRITTAIPVPASETIGREEDLERLRRWREAGHRLLTLVGPGGVGKSRLLHELGREVSGELVYVDLSGLTQASAQEVAAAICIEYRLGAAGPDPVATLSAALTRAHLTVLVDEAEWSSTAVATIARVLLEHCPGVSMVITSRTPLGVPGERLVPVELLDCPQSGEAGALARTLPAVRLLEARLTDRAPGLLITDDDGDQLGQIVRDVDGLPLGIELIAGQAATRSLTELSELTSRRLDVEDDRATGTDRHRSLRALAQSGIDRLGPAERATFRGVGVFRGSFTADAARVVVGDAATDHILRALARDAIIQLDRRGPRVRFRLLRTMRDLALELVAETGPDELARLQSRHREWYADRWRGVPFHDEMLNEVRDGLEDYLQALENALTCRDAHSVAGLGVTLGWYWLFHEAATTPWLDRILRSSLLSPADHAKIALMQRSLDESLTPHATAPDAATTKALLADDPEWAVLAGLVESIGAYVVGDVDTALLEAEALLEPAATTAAHALPEVLATVAVMRATAGQHDAALTAAEEAWHLIGSSPGVIQLSAVVAKIGLALLDAGHPSRALAILTKAIDDADRRLGVEPSGTLLLNAGWAALDCEVPEQAVYWFDRALNESPRVVQFFLAEAASGASATLCRLGVPGARGHSAAAAELCRRQGVPVFPRLTAAVDAAPASTGGADGDLEGGHVSRWVAVRDDELIVPICEAIQAVRQRTRP